MKLCPHCQTTTLFCGDSRDIKLAACSKCRGIWLDASTAARVYAAMQEVPPRGAHVGGLPCATCQRPMHMHKPGGTTIEIDICREHGVWFDRSELAALVGLAAERQGVTPPPLALDADATADATGPALVASAIAVSAVKLVLTADLVAKRASGHTEHEHEILNAMELTSHCSSLVSENASLGSEALGTAIENGGELVSGVAESVADGGALEAVGAALEFVLGLLEGLS